MNNPDCWNDVPEEFGTPRAILEYSEAGLATGSISGSVLDSITDEPVEDSSTGSIYLDMGWHKFVYRHHEGAEGQAARAAFKKPGDADWRLFSTSASELDICPEEPTGPSCPVANGINLTTKRMEIYHYYTPLNHQHMVHCVDEAATEDVGWYGQSVVDAVDHDYNVHGDDDGYTSYYEAWFYVPSAGWYFFATDFLLVAMGKQV
jgi:hypothetical protein